jgi:L-lactate dehydrogenase complex protein LldE
MRVGLFVPCYVDAFHPQVGIATLELLERFGIEVEYPSDQTCCGQPMTNGSCRTRIQRQLRRYLFETLKRFGLLVGRQAAC